MAKNNSGVGNYFVRKGEITEKQLAEALNKQEKTGKRLEEIFLDEGFVTEDKIKEYLKNRYNIVSVELADQNIESDVPLLISEDIARDYILIPFKKSQYRLLVAMVDPYDLDAIEDVENATGLTVLPRKAKARDIMQKIELHFSGKQPKNIFKAAEMLEKNLDKAKKLANLETKENPK